MKCFDKLFDDFVLAAQAGQLVEPRTAMEGRVQNVLVKRAAEQGISGFEKCAGCSKAICNGCSRVWRDELATANS